jgi:hypothetical protein
MAAMVASSWEIGQPATRRDAPISAETPAASPSKLETRPAKSSLKIATAASHNFFRR